MKNHTNITFFASFLLTLLFFFNSAKASNYQDGNNICYNLKSCYESKISKDLRKTFNDYLKNDKLEIPREMIWVKPRHLKNFKTKFIVLEIKNNPFGGYFLKIVINQKKMHLWYLWIYKTGEEEYQIRTLEEENIVQKEWIILLEKESLKYWQ